MEMNDHSSITVAVHQMTRGIDFVTQHSIIACFLSDLKPSSTFLRAGCPITPFCNTLKMVVSSRNFNIDADNNSTY